MEARIASQIDWASLLDDSTPQPVTTTELQRLVLHGNQRRPLPPKLSDRHKGHLTDMKKRWIRFCERLGTGHWRDLLVSLSYENRGLAESFIYFLIREADSGRRRPIRSQDTVRVYTRNLSGVYRQFSGRKIDSDLRDYLLNAIQVEITPRFKLRRDPKDKPVMGPDLFTFLQHFLWVRDMSNFRIGLDRLDDSCIRLFCMFTGCRKHELVYNATATDRQKVKEFDEEEDAFTDVEDESLQGRHGTCMGCGGPDERQLNPQLKVLCWEDIELWILQDPERNGGRDRLAMQTLHRYHKGENNKRVPTWFVFVEERLPILCPISHILAKALAEGVMAVGQPDRVDRFFSTNIQRGGVKIPWKPEFLHTPVFRKTVDSLEGGKKTNDPITRSFFDAHSTRLGKGAGLEENLTQYCYRRGFAETVDKNYQQSVRDQTLRHRPKSDTYQESYHNAKVNAVVQDAFLGRGTSTPYLAIMNHMGLRRDEAAPKRVPAEVMEMIGPSPAVRRLEAKLESLRRSLTEKFGKPSWATGEDMRQLKQTDNELRNAKQTQSRKILEKIRQQYFQMKDKERLEEHLFGDILAPSAVETPVELPATYAEPARKQVAEILSDLDEDLPDDEIVKRKVDAINAWVAYAFVSEPRTAASSKAPKAATPKLPGHSKSGRPSFNPPPSRPDQATSNQNSSLKFALEMEGSFHDDVATADCIVCMPPPPYSETDSSRRSAPNNTTSKARAPREAAKPSPVPCIFCGKQYKRNATMWDHVEDHLRHATDGRIACPLPECKTRGLVCDGIMKFKAHVHRVHNVKLRPGI